MKRGLDFDKAQAALKRAAEKAIYGTREERSGRFHARNIERHLQGDDAIEREGGHIHDTTAGPGDKTS